ncbi:hypothetical protein CYMTET_18831 [Cymbomonas tetramitiformis]|uniref:Uncharacterized protein n=1 Tax=Cymbomonas tetramitiformis TaxID=36881 RepID=A0AAE0L5Y5_9CHLO|nr:hypothetical protein CYMTET_18831 [Cymbomonas tetramitiformis]
MQPPPGVFTQPAQAAQASLATSMQPAGDHSQPALQPAQVTRSQHTDRWASLAASKATQGVTRSQPHLNRTGTRVLPSPALLAPTPEVDPRQLSDLPEELSDLQLTLKIKAALEDRLEEKAKAAALLAAEEDRFGDGSGVGGGDEEPAASPENSSALRGASAEPRANPAERYTAVVDCSPDPTMLSGMVMITLCIGLTASCGAAWVQQYLPDVSRAADRLQVASVCGSIAISFLLVANAMNVYTAGAVAMGVGTGVVAVWQALRWALRDKAKAPDVRSPAKYSTAPSAVRFMAANERQGVGEMPQPQVPKLDLQILPDDPSKRPSFATVDVGPVFAPPKEPVENPEGGGSAAVSKGKGGAVSGGSSGRSGRAPGWQVCSDDAKGKERADIFAWDYESAISPAAAHAASIGEAVVQASTAPSAGGESGQRADGNPTRKKAMAAGELRGKSFSEYLFGGGLDFLEDEVAGAARIPSEDRPGGHQVVDTGNRRLGVARGLDKPTAPVLGGIFHSDRKGAAPSTSRGPAGSAHTRRPEYKRLLHNSAKLT